MEYLEDVRLVACDDLNLGNLLALDRTEAVALGEVEDIGRLAATTDGS